METSCECNTDITFGLLISKQVACLHIQQIITPKSQCAKSALFQRGQSCSAAPTPPLLPVNSYGPHGSSPNYHPFFGKHPRGFLPPPPPPRWLCDILWIGWRGKWQATREREQYGRDWQTIALFFLCFHMFRKQHFISPKSPHLSCDDTEDISP